MPPTSPLRFLCGRQLARSLLVGFAATAADISVLAALVELFGLSPTIANVPSLLAGAVVQFLGCRWFVFPRGEVSLFKQITGFLAAEAGTLTLNGMAFFALVRASLVPYALARPLATFVVFVGFSYPAWKRVFLGSASRPARAKIS
jgi:putative flippase GtrA